MECHDYTINQEDNNLIDDTNVEVETYYDLPISQPINDDLYVTRIEFNLFKQSVKEMMDKLKEKNTLPLTQKDTNDIIYISGTYPVLKTAIANGLSGNNPKLNNFFIEVCKSAFSPDEYINRNLKGSNGKLMVDEQKLSEIIRFTLSRWKQYWRDDRHVDLSSIEAKSFQELKSYFAQWIDRTTRRHNSKFTNDG